MMPYDLFLRALRMIVPACCLILFLGGCGIKGPLYIPKEEPPPEPAAVQSAAPNTAETSEAP